MKRIKWIFFFLSVLAKIMTTSEAWPNTFDLDSIDASVDVGETSSSIALDSLSHQGICYHNQTNRALQFAYFNGDDWEIETVDGNDGSGKSIGLECALAFDDQDQPHIVYYNITDGEIRHAYHDGQRWHIAVVDDDTHYDILGFGAQRLSLKRNPLGGIGIAYYALGHRDLVYAEWDGHDWVLETVENQGDSGRHPSLAYTSDGRPAISFVRHINNNRAELKYVEFDGQNWLQAVAIDDEDYAGRYSSLVFDHNDVPHVSYHHMLNGVQGLRYTNRVGGQWNNYFTVKEGGVAFASAGEYAQMTIDPTGHAHIFYRYYFFSALFGRAFYLKMNTLYFAAQHIPSEIGYREESLMASVAPTRDYYGTSVDIDDNYHLVYSAVIENVFAQTDALHAGELEQWSPYAEYVTSQDVVAENDRVSIRWRDFDPDSDAKIRFSFRQGIDDPINIEGVLSEDDRADRVTLDTSVLAPGRYNLVMEISDDDFVMSSSSWSQFQVIIPERPEPEPAPQQEAEQPAQARAEEPQQQQAPAPNQEAEAAQEQAAPAEPAQQNQQQEHPAENQEQQNRAEAAAAPQQQEPAQAEPARQNQQDNHPVQNQVPQQNQANQNPAHPNQAPQAQPNNQPQNPVQKPQNNALAPEPAQPVLQAQQQQPQAQAQADNVPMGDAVDQEPQEEAPVEEEILSSPAADEPLQQPQDQPEEASVLSGSTANSDADSTSSGIELAKVIPSCSLSSLSPDSSHDGSLMMMVMAVVGLLVWRRYSTLDGRA